jgi:uroporphyrinogen-III synthase
MIQIRPVPISQPVASALARLREFDWLVLTSARAVTALKTLAAEAKVTFDPMPPVAAVGAQTAATAKRAGWTVGFQAQPATANALGSGLTPVKGKHVLWARTELATTELADTLRFRGAHVTDLTVYTTQPATQFNPRLEELVRDRQVGWVTFASESALAGFEHSLSPAMLERARSLPAVAIGHPTAYAAATAGWRNVKVAREPNVKGIISALRDV